MIAESYFLKFGLKEWLSSKFLKLVFIKYSSNLFFFQPILKSKSSLLGFHVRRIEDRILNFPKTDKLKLGN